MYVSKLILQNWRNFKSVEVALTQRVFVVGPNASGKSNFLDAIRFLRDLCKSGGGLQQSVTSQRGGVSKIRCLAAKGQSDIVVGVELSDDTTNQMRWKYEIAFNQTGGGVRDLKAVIKYERVWKGTEELINRPDKKDEGDPKLLQYTHLEQPTSNNQFREISDFLSDIQYLHIVPHLVRSSRQIIMSDGIEDYLGKDFIERINKMNSRTQHVLLRRIEKALKAAVPQFKDLKLVKDSKGVPHLQAIYQHWRAQGAKQQEDQFSDGTLRLIGVLWALMDGLRPVLLEEPELSLHPAIVKQLAELVTLLQRRKQVRRQVILSTHSYDLLSNNGIAGEEIVLLVPSAEGTKALVAAGDKTIRSLLESGLSVAEAVLPFSTPKDAQQLSLFESQSK